LILREQVIKPVWPEYVDPSAVVHPRIFIHSMIACNRLLNRIEEIFIIDGLAQELQRGRFHGAHRRRISP